MPMNGPAFRPAPARCPFASLGARALELALLTALAACVRTPRDGEAGVDAGRAALLDPSDSLWSAHAPDTFDVRIETSKGPFTIRVLRGWAPRGADRFFNLVRAGFYDDSRFFRVREGFIAQFGLPGDPAIAPHWIDNAIPDDPVNTSNVRGTVAFAMTGPDTRTTQVYMNLADNDRLDAQGFAPFGRVMEGMDVVDRLYAGYDESAGGGVRGGKQGRIIAEGNAHLDRDFPLLDHLVSARIVRQLRSPSTRRERSMVPDLSQVASGPAAGEAERTRSSSSRTHPSPASFHAAASQGARRPTPVGAGTS